jgi:hypothetical protein
LVARCRSFQDQVQQGGKDLLFGHRGVSAVGVEDRFIEGLMSQGTAQASEFLSSLSPFNVVE